MFLQGEIVKSKSRTEEYPLFLMVLFDKSPSQDQFNAVVLLDKNNEEEPGEVSNVWNYDKFQLTDWDDFKKYV